MRADPRAVGEQRRRARSVPAAIRSSRSTTRGRRARRRPADSRRCRGQARSRYRPNVAAGSASASRRRSTRSPRPRDPTRPSRPARRPRAGRAPPECPAAPKALPAQRLPGRTPGNGPASDAGDLAPARLQQRQRVQRQRVEEPAAGVARRCRGRPAPGSGRAPRSASPATPSTSPVECAWSVDTTSTRMPGARIAHGGGGRQRGLAYPALADEEADPGAPAAAVSAALAALTQPRLVS